MAYAKDDGSQEIALAISYSDPAGGLGLDEIINRVNFLYIRHFKKNDLPMLFTCVVIVVTGIQLICC